MDNEKLEELINSYMTACYGGDWKTGLDERPKKELIQAFLSGMIQVSSLYGIIEIVPAIHNKLGEMGCLP